jgi:hypothetical protein
MALKDPDSTPSLRQVRHFAWMLALILAVAAWRWFNPVAAFVVRVLAGLIFTFGTLCPGMFRWVHRALVAITAPLGRLISNLLLAMIYFGLITPLSLCFRLVGRDPLARRLQFEAASYWQPRFQVTERSGYFRQF